MHNTTPLLSTAEAAERAGVDRSTITRWVQSGRLTAAHRTSGGFLLFHPDAIDSAVGAAEAAS